MKYQLGLLLFVWLMGAAVRCGEVVLETAGLKDFNTITSIVMGNKEDIFAFSRSGSKIFKFTAGGKPVTSFGRPGEGPGEMKRVLFMFHNPNNDRLYLPEFSGRGRISVFDTQGAFKGYLEIELTPNQKNRVWQLLFRQDGSFFAQLSERVGWQPTGKYYLTRDKLRLLYFDASGKFLNEVYSTMENHEMADKPGMGGPRILFSPQTLLRLTPRGNLCVMKTDDPEKRILNVFGKQLRSRVLEIKKQVLSDDEFQSTKEELLTYIKDPRMKMLARNMVNPDFKPIFQAVYFSGTWTVLTIEKRANILDPVEATVLAFYDDEGKYRYSVEIQGRVLNITGGRMFSLEVDEEDNETYKVSELPRVKL